MVHDVDHIQSMTLFAYSYAVACSSNTASPPHPARHYMRLSTCVTAINTALGWRPPALLRATIVSSVSP